MMNIQRRLLILGAALLACTAQAQGTAPKYGVVSLLGESITVTGSRPTTGSRVDQNDKLTIPLPDAGFDATALRTIEETVKTLAPQSATLLFRIKAPHWVENPSSLFESNKVAMSPKLIEAMKADGATHLILLTRMRAETQLRFENGWEGKGRVEGLGFYIDREQWVVNKATGHGAQGYLAPHAYLRLSLVDLSNATVIKRSTVATAHIYSTTVKQTVSDPWQSIDGAEKLKVLNQMIEDELKTALGALLQAR